MPPRLVPGGVTYGGEVSASDVLNPQASDAEHEAVALSRLLLAAVRAPDGRARPLAAQLHGVEPAGLDGDDARIAFWLNVYNALVGDWLRAHPPRGRLLRELRVFGRAAYAVGGLIFTPDQIEHGLLRRNRRPPYRPRRILRAGDPRETAMPSRFDPRIHFALNCGARSCPPIESYSAEGLGDQLELATRSYLSAETVADAASGRVALPGLMRLYRGDFGSKEGCLRYVAARVPAVESTLASPRAPRVSFRRFDWTAGPPAAALAPEI